MFRVIKKNYPCLISAKFMISENYEENGTICLRVAFSRDQNHKVYVQDLLQEDGYKIWKLLSKVI